MRLFLTGWRPPDFAALIFFLTLLFLSVLHVSCLLLGRVKQNMPVQVIARKTAGKGKKLVNAGKKERGRERKKGLEFEKKKQVTAHTIGPTPTHRPWRNAELSEKHALVDCMGGSQSVSEPVIRVPIAAGKSFDTRLPDRPVVSMFPSSAPSSA